MVRGFSLKGLGANEVDAVVSASLCLDGETNSGVAADHPAPFGGHKVGASGFRRQYDDRCVNQRIAAEGCRILQNHPLQIMLISWLWSQAVLQMSGWRLRSKIVGSVFFLGVDLGFGFGVQVGFRRFAVTLVGQIPQGASDGIGIVIQRQGLRADGRFAALPMCVVQVGAANPRNGIGPAGLHLRRVEQTSLARHHHGRGLVANGVTDEVRSRIKFCKVGMSPL